ncbi:MAG TPA: SDR family NAD(P)-dependent oxidoreductase [Chitinophagaceae bacterium]|jgi:short-subunit dehydrogenase|nr:SDR family NAD(P)-dependent oxidoreductase [Chitinophagaceae bacterium]
MQPYSIQDQETIKGIKETSVPASGAVGEPYTLITGASHGIGLCYAREFARRGRPLLLVALPEEKLEKVTSEIRREYHVQVDTVGIDLTADHAPQEVWRYCKKRNYTIDTLVNNAGIGFASRFENISMDNNLVMIRLNTEAMVGLTHYFLPMLQAQPQGHIVYMSSMEATLSLPYKSVYTSTKSFIYSFALALREELKKTKVKIHVVCPGPVLTNADGLERIHTQGWKARMLMKSPDEVAAYAIGKMDRNAVRIVPGSMNRLLLWVAGHLPRPLRMNLLERIFRCFKDHQMRDEK